MTQSADAKRYLIPVLLSLTLGLAPFAPEPHLLGKLRWVLGGGGGMSALDVFDLLLHGAPWVWLLAIAVADLVHVMRKDPPGGSPG